ncbi:MAG TPA: hypothetical protein VJZ27_03615, partial [Aggregatilineales bacterium]|nr:hypothetical protein [Aggregatilineales bacterium]
TLRARGKRVVVWGVRGSTSRILENNPSIKLEYFDEFALFRRHKDLGDIFEGGYEEFEEEENDFRPSQWSSLVLQFDYLKVSQKGKITSDTLARRLEAVGTTANYDRAVDLIEQAIQIGILKENRRSGMIDLREEHPIVSRTHQIRDHIVTRVSNTLSVRSWDYVNYGFLLKGIAMDDQLAGIGINIDDNWRSEWIDFLVREGVLERELIPHRHNPDDLVPVISVPEAASQLNITTHEEPVSQSAIENMAYRVIVSVEQFTSFRKFVWCPLGSLHKRLRPFDDSTAFQQAVEMLESENAVLISEYSNPQSNFLTKGVSLLSDSPLVKKVISERNRFIQVLLKLYEQRQLITSASIEGMTGLSEHEMDLWISIMQLENVLNTVPGQPGVYSLFRTHHTVSIVADD